MKVKVEYVGKKKNFVYKNKFGHESVELSFNKPGATAFISKTALDNILKYNPTGFLEVIDGKPEEEVAEEVAAEKKETFICPTCFKAYTDEMWYDKHVKVCMAKGADDVVILNSDDGSSMDGE
jgi:hypothetical protein